MAYVEAELERDIALGRLPPSGQFGSEATLARRHNVCRGTIREALRRLAARGLVVQRSGRKTRAVALDESLTLENLGLALHDARSPEARWLLEGYFSLRRQVLVELLVDCCAKASERDLDVLGSLCFRLWDAAKWELGERCAQVEFELLRLAARMAERPGHVLLVQSLHRAFLGGPARLLPFMEGEALRQWVICATDALRERDTRALQQDLPTLMKACDDRLLNAFAPVAREPDAPVSQGESLSPPSSAPVLDENREEYLRLEGGGIGSPASAVKAAEVIGFGSSTHVSSLAVAPSNTALLSSAEMEPPSRKTGAEEARGDGLNEPSGNLSDDRTYCGSPFPRETPQPDPRPIGSCRQPERTGGAHVERPHSHPWKRGIHARPIHQLLVSCLDALCVHSARFKRAMNVFHERSSASRRNSAASH